MSTTVATSRAYGAAVAENVVAALNSMGAQPQGCYGVQAPVPALALDFLTQSLDSRITFSRADGSGRATRVNSAGLIETVPVNLLLQSNSFATTWVEVGTGVRGGSADVVGIDGTVSAWTLTDNDPASSEFIHQSATLTAANYTASVYIKKTSGAQASYPVIQLFDSGSLTSLCTVDTTNGIATVWTAYTGRTIQTSSAACSSFGDYWRVSLTFLATGASWRVGLFPAGSTSATQATGIIDVAAQGSAVVTATQLQTGSVATTYIPTTTTASGAPRFDYDPVTLAPRGLLIEESRTNILTYSNDLSSATAAWTPTLGTAVISGTAPDGTATATLFTPSAGTAQHYVSRTVTGISTATAYSFSVFAKSNGKTFFSIYCASMPLIGAAWFTLTGAGTVSNLTAGVTATIQAFPNGWYLCTYTGTTMSTGTTIELHTGSTLGNFSDVANGTDGIYLWGAQFETASASGAAPFSTSLIPTTTAAVTRAADVASMTGTNFSSWFNATEGTFVAKGDSIASSAVSNRRIVSCYSGGTFDLMFNTGSAQAKVGSTFSSSIVTNAAGIPSTLVGAYSVSPCSFVVNGSAVSNTPADVIGAPTALQLGATGTSYLGGHLQRITYYNKRLPDNTLKALSA